MVATRSARFSRCVLRCQGSRSPSTALMLRAACSIPPIQTPNPSKNGPSSSRYPTVNHFRPKPIGGEPGRLSLAGFRSISQGPRGWICPPRQDDDCSCRLLYYCPWHHKYERKKGGGKNAPEGARAFLCAHHRSLGDWARGCVLLETWRRNEYRSGLDRQIDRTAVCHAGRGPEFLRVLLTHHSSYFLWRLFGR